MSVTSVTSVMSVMSVKVSFELGEKSSRIYNKNYNYFYYIYVSSKKGELKIEFDTHDTHDTHDTRDTPPEKVDWFFYIFLSSREA